MQPAGCGELHLVGREGLQRGGAGTGTVAGQADRGSFRWSRASPLFLLGSSRFIFLDS